MHLANSLVHIDSFQAYETKKYNPCVWGYMLHIIRVDRKAGFFIMIFYYTKSMRNTEAKSSQI